MTDKELLELAAKAAGINAKWYDNTGCMMRINSGSGLARWNPLTDDGDALRLDVKLDIQNGKRWAGILGETRMHVINESDEPCQCAATRRAIVLAAAEIGKEMP
jgi:hypothetical protein